MRGPLAAVLVACLAACAAAKVELHTLKEGSDVPGVTGGSYAIVKDGEVVGLVEHYQSETPLGGGGRRPMFGRRGGPGQQPIWRPRRDATAEAEPAAVVIGKAVDQYSEPSYGGDVNTPSMGAALGSLADKVARHMDIFATLQQQAVASRCQRARAAALARLAAATRSMDAEPAVSAAAGAVEEGPRPWHPLPKSRHSLLPEPVPEDGTLPAEELVEGQDSAEMRLFGGAATAVQEAEAARRAEEAAMAAADAAASLASGEPMGWGDFSDMDMEVVAEASRGSSGDSGSGPMSNPLMQLLMPSWVQRFAEEAAVEGGSGDASSPHAGGGTASGQLPWRMEERMRLMRMLGGEELPLPAEGGEAAGPYIYPALPIVPHHMRHPRPTAWESMGFDDSLPVSVWVQTNGGWVALNPDAISPARERPDMTWRLFDGRGHLNWGLILFVALSVACVAVWGAMLMQYLSYRSARASNDRASFITRADGPDNLKPLLHEGPLDSAMVAGGCVEVAAEHVPSSERIITVLHYEPLNSK